MFENCAFHIAVALGEGIIAGCSIEEPEAFWWSGAPLFVIILSEMATLDGGEIDGAAFTFLYSIYLIFVTESFSRNRNLSYVYNYRRW